MRRPETSNRVPEVARARLYAPAVPLLSET